MQLSAEDLEFLKTYSAAEYEKPSCASDTALFRYLWQPGSKPKIQILLIQRKHPPYKGGWALPGGFCDMDESLLETAKRELKEETGLSARYYGQICTYSTVNRDPRTRVIGTSHLAVLSKNSEQTALAGDDAALAKWFDVQLQRRALDSKNYEIRLVLKNEEFQLEGVVRISQNEGGEWERQIMESEGIAFDHAEVIACAVEMLKQKTWQTDIAFNFVDEEFNLADLQRVYETISQKELLRTTFFTHIKPLLERAEGQESNGDILKQRYRFNRDFRFEDSASMIDVWM